MIATVQNDFYVIGGTLRTDAPSYVQRRADEILFTALRQGQFCYLLTSRQMGKSSLMVRTAKRLRESGYDVVVLDLTAVGQNLTVEQWYEGLIGLMGQQLNREYELEEFWFAHERLAPLQRWRRALLTFLLPRLRQPLVIFVDEIDAVRSLNFSTDEFFATIREFHNQRTTNPELARLTFCLLGVATPSDLIRDTRTTPFNIGNRIKLRDFTEAEAAPLMYGLTSDAQRGSLLLKRILHWTGGHPYLTQRLCQAVAQAEAATTDDVDRLCEELFLSPRARERDDNLLFVRERLLRSEADLASLLELYARALRGKPVKDDETNPLISILRLSGIVQSRQSALAVRNRIYARVFDREWIAANMPNAELERQRRAFRRGQWRMLALAGSIIFFLGISFAITQRERQRAETSLYLARMNLAQQAWESGNVARVLDLLGTASGARNFEWEHLWQLTHQYQQEWRLDASVTALALSPDGQWLAAALASNKNKSSIRLWARGNPATSTTWTAHEGAINSLSFSQDGAQLASGGDDNKVYLWSTNSHPGQPLALFTGHSDSVHTVLLMRNANGAEVLLSGAEDGEVCWWDTQNQRLLQSITEDAADPILALALSPDRQTLALASSQGEVVLWDAVRRIRLRRLPLAGAETGLRCVQFSSDNAWLAAGTESGRVQLWSTRGWLPQWNMQPSSKSITSLAFAPDGRQLAIGGIERCFWLADTHSGQLSEGLKGFTEMVTALLFTTEKNQLLSASSDRRVRLWQLDRAPVVADYASDLAEISAVSFAPDESQLAVGGERGLQLWRLTAHGVEKAWDSRSPFNADELQLVTAAAWSSDGKQLAVAGEKNGLRLLNAQTGQLTAQWLHDLSETAELNLKTLAFAPTQPHLAAGGTLTNAESGQTRHLLYVLDLITGKLLATRAEHKDPLTATAYSPDGRWLVTGSRDGRILWWDAASYQRSGEITLPDKAPVLALAFDAQGKTLATAGEKQGVVLWDTATRQPRLQLAGHAEDVTSLQFTADGQRLFTASKDQTIKLWDTATGQEVVTYKMTNGEPRVLAFAPRSRALAVSSDKGQIKLWRQPDNRQPNAR
jgi:WD40 repeat protein